MKFASKRLNEDEYRRNELIQKIERTIEHMSLKELEALAYDMFTKGYTEDI